MYGRHFLVEASTASKVVAAGLTGALLVLALPKPDLYYLSWLAFVPLLLALSPEDSILKTFGIGYAAGLVFFSGSCYWIVKTMATYGGLPMGTSLAVFALFVSVFALHTALFAVLLQLQLARFGHWGLLLAAPTWVAVELIQTYAIFGGFPWMLVGYALAPYTGLLQVVDDYRGLRAVVSSGGRGLAPGAQSPDKEHQARSRRRQYHAHRQLRAGPSRRSDR